MHHIKELSKASLCSFLAKAKVDGYASNQSKIASKNILSKNYLYVDGDFRYEDQYYGEYLDMGQETVWYKEVPVWSMTYRGGIYKPYYPEAEQAFHFLKQALKQPEKDFPIRGPGKLTQTLYHYCNLPVGDILSFSGKEYVYKDDEEICFRPYFGGIIYGKFNKDMVIID